MSSAIANNVDRTTHRASLILIIRDILLLLHPVLVIAFVVLRSGTIFTRTTPSGIEDIFFLRVMRLLRLAGPVLAQSRWLPIAGADWGCVRPDRLPSVLRLHRRLDRSHESSSASFIDPTR